MNQNQIKSNQACESEQNQTENLYWLSALDTKNIKVGHRDWLHSIK